MRRLWKLGIPVGPGVFEVNSPQGAILLSVAWVKEAPAIYAECNPSAPFGKRCFVVIGTGDWVPRAADRLSSLPYVGTYLVGRYVWHIYDKGEVQ